MTPYDETNQGWRRQRNKQGRTEEEANQLYRWPQMTGQARYEEDNATNRAEWMKKLISYTGDPRWRDKPGMKKTTQQTGQHGGIRSSAIPVTPDDGIIQGLRRRSWEDIVMWPRDNRAHRMVDELSFEGNRHLPELVNRVDSIRGSKTGESYTSEMLVGSTKKMTKNRYAQVGSCCSFFNTVDGHAHYHTRIRTWWIWSGRK